MSRHYTIKDAAWLLLAVFSQVYSENPEQKAEQTDLKNTVWSENKYIQAADKGAVAKEVNAIKKKPNVNPVSYNDNQPGNGYSLVQQWHKCYGVTNYFLVGFKACSTGENSCNIL